MRRLLPMTPGTSGLRRFDPVVFTLRLLGRTFGLPDSVSGLACVQYWDPGFDRLWRWGSITYMIKVR